MRHGGNLLCQVKEENSAVRRSVLRGVALATDRDLWQVPVLLDFGNCIRLPEEQRVPDMFEGFVEGWQDHIMSCHIILYHTIS